MGNYSATVVRLKDVRKHSNADRLQCTNIFGNNVIIGLDAKPGDLGLFFPLESQIGLEFAQANDLIRRKGPDGKPAGGMFDENRRVRCQTFRGEKSMGFWIPIDSLDNLIPGTTGGLTVEGTEIEFIRRGDKTFLISQKYIPRIAEGIVVRKEGLTIEAYKLKSFRFFEYETKQLDKGEVNIEDGAE